MKKVEIDNFIFHKKSIWFTQKCFDSTNFLNIHAHICPMIIGYNDPIVSINVISAFLRVKSPLPEAMLAFISATSLSLPFSRKSSIIFLISSFLRSPNFYNYMPSLVTFFKSGFSSSIDFLSFLVPNKNKWAMYPNPNPVKMLNYIGSAFWNS